MLLRVAVCLVPVLASLPAAGKPIRLKMAMIAPERSVWVREFETADREIRAATNGQVVLKIYPGGVQGDEPTMVRKMRIGQLHGGGFMVRGINMMCPDSTVFSIPLLFREAAEADYVLLRMAPYLAAQARENGYEIIGWTRQGFAYLFSREDVRDIGSLRKAKPWLLEDDIFGRAFYQAAQVSAVPAQVGDVLTGLQSGLIHTVFTPPVGMIALQWHTRVRYHLDLGLFFSFGAVVVSKRAWDRIPEALQDKITEVFDRRVSELSGKMASQNAEALAVIGRNVTTVRPSEPALAEFRGMTDKVVRELRAQHAFSEEALALVQSHLAAYRRSSEGK